MSAEPSTMAEHSAVLHALVSSSPDHFYLYDRAGRHLYASPAAAQALGLAQEDFLGKTWQDLGFPPDTAERLGVEVETAFKQGRHWRGEMILPTEMGQPNTLHDYVLSPVRADDGSIEAVLVTARDITERKQLEADLQYRALHDALTGLANRALLNDRLEQHLLSAHRTGHSLAIVFLDLDRFKDVNDTVGHHGGDQLLQELAVRWSSTLRASDTLSRLGGDEFVVLLPDTDEAGADEAAHKLRLEVERPFDIEGHHLSIGVSIGIATHRGAYLGANDLMRQADEAMYEAKRRRKCDTGPGEESARL